MSPLAFLDIGFGEMMVVAFVALILFGGRLPEVMRSLGASYRSFRRGMEDMTRQVSRPDFSIKPPAVPYRPTPPIPPPLGTLPPGAGTPRPLSPSLATGAPPPSPAVSPGGAAPAMPAPRAAESPPQPPVHEAPRATREDDTPHV